MSAWIPARPSQMLRDDLKRLGFSKSKIDKLLAAKDKNALRAEATRMIEENRSKEKDIKGACNKFIPGLNW
jgi:hypothetical protein